MQTTRIFNADVGDESVGNAGPDAIEQDLDNLYQNKAWKDEVLTRNNTEVYIPSNDYNPATKKYVDGYLADIATSVYNLTEELERKAYKSDVLELNNQAEYEPLTDYNPATKKYTDDKVGNIIELVNEAFKVYDDDLNGVIDNAEKVNGHTVESDVPANAVFTDTVYTHPNTHNAGMIIQTINAQTGTTYTITGTDANNIVTLNNADPITVTLPQDLDLDFDIGKKIDFIVLGLGMATFQAGTGATLRTATTAVTKGQYAFVTVIKIASNTWLIKGELNSI